jgi:hypothetical protein
MRNLLRCLLPFLALLGCSSGDDAAADAAADAGDVSADLADTDATIDEGTAEAVDDGAPDDAAGDDGAGWEYTEERAPCADREPLRRPLWGDLHAHTRLSFDAWGYDLRVSPDEAYGFARGAEVRLPPLAADGRGTRVVRLDRPLDFAALTDHLDLLGEVRLCLTPGSPAYDTGACVGFRAGGEDAVGRFGMLLAPLDPQRPAEICGAGGAACRAAATEVWAELVAAAEAAYDRTATCGFVAFPAYEYTASTYVSNLHRNVLFRNATVPELPPSVFEARTPLELWTALAAQCLDAGSGCDVMVLPHNANWSNGRLFVPDYGADADLAEQRRIAALRARLEPVFEIFQHKGNQECHDALAGVAGLDDPLCAFERIRVPPFDDCGDGVGTAGIMGLGCVSRYDYVRNVLKLGLQERARLGVNPYRLAFIGSTDNHNGTPGNVDERGFPGHVGLVDDTERKRLGDGTVTHEGLINNPGGLAGVWAEERSRDAIFAALRRGETFATTGPRIVVRLFGAWDLPAGLCDGDDATLAAAGYARGVPMGGTLPARGAATAPTFAVRAQADPGTVAEPGTPLQRLQVVKGWLDAAGVPQERVYDVAGDPDNGASVDRATCERSGAGFETLCAVWRDPEFDPARPAFYYARAVENPSCRWSAHDCNALAPADRPSVCSDPAVSHVIQERAWASPIWYEP